jgi:hypothetical protein
MGLFGHYFLQKTCWRMESKVCSKLGLVVYSSGALSYQITRCGSVISCNISHKEANHPYAHVCVWTLYHLI